MARTLYQLFLEEDSDFSAEFAKLMQNRMDCSRHKYGKWKDNQKIVDCKANFLRRWEEYERTGNTEFLVDCANFAMMEWLLSKHSGAHFRPTESHEAPPLKCVPEDLPSSMTTKKIRSSKKVTKKKGK